MRFVSASCQRAAARRVPEGRRLAYGRIPELEKKLKEVEGKNAGAVVEEADSSHVAQIVSRWTGIPVDRMLEGEREKRSRWTQIGKRVVARPKP